MKKIKAVSDRIFGMRRRHLLGASAFVAVFATIGVIFLLRSLAAGELLYVTPATSNVQTGSDVTVTIRLNPGTTGANAVDATLTYDQTKLQYKSIDVTASAYTSNFIATGGNGTVNVVSAVPSTTITADAEVAKVTFTAIASTAGATPITVTGQATNGGNDLVLGLQNASVNITVPTAPARSAAYTIESTVAAPLANTQFGLRVYITATNANIQGGEVHVNLPAGLSYQGTLDTAGTAFNPATTVAGTTAQQVRLVYVTQATNLTGKQLIATIPVIGTTTGAKSVTFANARVADTNSVDITPVTSDPFSITINSASLPAPVLSIPGKAQIAATENITDLRQTFTIANFDSAATYTVTFSGQNLALSGSSFSIPAAVRNGDLSLQVSASRSGASGNSSFTIRLRSPNVNRTACVELSDLLSVNQSYGRASTEFDLNFDGTVGIIDLLTVTGNWGGSCI